jgi:hypothetical protein
MNKSYNVRPIKVKDYVFLSEWWKSYNGIELPDSGALPNNGLGGFIVEVKKRPIAAAYLYLTNSTIGYIDFLISDPNYKNKHRYDAIATLILACSNHAIKLGCKVVWAMTSYDGIIKRCKELGGDVLKDKYTIIYTNKQK